MAEKRVWVEGGTVEAVAGPMQYIGQGEQRIWIEGGNIAIAGGGAGLDYQGNYSLSTQYTTGQVVTFNGSLYQALQDTIGNDPPNNDGGTYQSMNGFIPEILVNSEATALSIGSQFMVDQQCVLSAARFYKGDSTNGGTHVARLWNAGNASQISSVTFTGETASGWQRQAFPDTPLLQPWTRYIISIDTPQGHYSNTLHLFDGGHFIDGPIRTDNGMFNSSVSAIPNTVFSNGWYAVGVEVLVSQNLNWKLLAKGDWGTV